MTVLSHLGYLALALLVGGESIGLLLPGETAILTAGILAREGRLEIGVVVAVAAVAAVVGDNLGYLLARRGGRGLLTARGPRRERRLKLLERGERFFARYGGRAVFLGRWIAFARVTVPWLAGASRMPQRRFLLWNALGGLTWSGTVGLAGYGVGAAARTIFTSTAAAGVALLAVLALTAAWRAHRARGAAAGGHP